MRPMNTMISLRIHEELDPSAKTAKPVSMASVFAEALCYIFALTNIFRVILAYKGTLAVLGTRYSWKSTISYYYSEARLHQSLF